MYFFSSTYNIQDLLKFKLEFDSFSKGLPNTYDGGRELLYFVFANDIAIAIFNKIDSESVEILFDDFFTRKYEGEEYSERYDDAYCSDWESWCDTVMHLIDEGHTFDNMDACKITNWSMSRDPFKLFREPYCLIVKLQNILCEMIANQEMDVNKMLEEVSCIENIDTPLQIALFRRLAKRIEYLEYRVEQFEKTGKK